MCSCAAAAPAAAEGLGSAGDASGGRGLGPAGVSGTERGALRAPSRSALSVGGGWGQGLSWKRSSLVRSAVVQKPHANQHKRPRAFSSPPTHTPPPPPPPSAHLNRSMMPSNVGRSRGSVAQHSTMRAYTSWGQRGGRSRRWPSRTRWTTFGVFRGGAVGHLVGWLVRLVWLVVWLG